MLMWLFADAGASVFCLEKKKGETIMISKETNKEIRNAISRKRLRYYEVANECGVSVYTFSHWLQQELEESKKQIILDAIDKIVI